MNKYNYTEKCREISGFGGGYEDTCRKMVIAAMEWKENNQDSEPTFKQFKNIYGLTSGENDDMKSMQDAMLKAAGGDCSGAMMQASTNHALFAQKNGWEKYIEEMEKKSDEEE